ncbi:hypothetical protein TNCV_4458191 [Trichonephila clavipes]|nr:hypothetical protein TNCV_4458191 [Trichonephila clavipes]
MNATGSLARRYSTNNQFATVHCVTLVPTKAVISAADALHCASTMRCIRWISLSVVTRAWLDTGFLEIGPIPGPLLPTRYVFGGTEARIHDTPTTSP